MKSSCDESSRRITPRSRPHGRADALGAAIVLCSLLYCGPGQLSADAGANRQAMADAMTRMMEAMGFLDSGSSFGNPMSGMGMPSPFGMPGWGMGGWPGSSFGSGQFGDYGRIGKEWMDRFSPQMPQGMPGMDAMPWGASPLEGVWEGAGGGLLIVQGGFYRLYAGAGGFVDGRIETDGQQLRLFNREAGFDLRFEFAEEQGRLVLRDEGGQVYLYRRLVLNRGDGG